MVSLEMELEKVLEECNKKNRKMEVKRSRGGGEQDRVECTRLVVRRKNQPREKDRKTKEVRERERDKRTKRQTDTDRKRKTKRNKDRDK